MFLPQDGFDAHPPGELAVQPIGCHGDALPLRADVGGRGDEQPDHRFGHGGAFCGSR